MVTTAMVTPSRASDKPILLYFSKNTQHSKARRILGYFWHHTQQTLRTAPISWDFNTTGDSKKYLYFCICRLN